MSDRTASADQQKMVGQYFLANLAEAGLNQTEFALERNLQRHTVNNLARGKKRVDASLARVLARCFEKDERYWLDLQREADLGTLKPPLADRGALDSLSVVAAGVLNDLDTETMVEQAGLIGEGWDPARLRGASYDCQAGHFHRSGRWATIDSERGLEFGAGERLTVRTQEYFSLPPNISGNFGSTGEIVKRGFTVNCGHFIHPGFHGRLTVEMWNHRDSPATLQISDRFLSVRFLTMTGPASKAYSDASIDEEEIEKQARIRELEEELAALKAAGPDKADLP
ncbi:MAG: hypothetical protein AAGJ28_15585 [Pseudomonadota bacterium]